MPELLKPARLQPALHKRSHSSKKPERHKEEQALLLQLEKARALSNEHPVQPKIKSTLKKKSLSTHSISASQSAILDFVSILGHYVNFHLGLELHTRSRKFSRLRTASEATGRG